MATVTQDLKTISRRFWEDGANQRRWDVLDEIIANDYVGHGAEDSRGREALKAVLMSYAAAFPDIHYTIEDLMSEGDRIICRWTARGTHKGPLLDIPPTGKPMTVTGISIDRVVDGKVVEGWTEFDMLGMLQQLGVLPPLGQ